MNSLPSPILQNIFSFSTELYKLSQVCKLWRIVIHNLDISLGLESCRIACACCSSPTKNTKCPCYTAISSITYTNFLIYEPLLDVVELGGGCKCKSSCTSVTKCTCLQKMNKNVYDLNGILDLGDVWSDVNQPIFECFSECSCSMNCSNRVVQKGLQISGLQVFDTKTKGLGVRTIVPIKKGTFICEYIGEVITSETADKRIKKLKPTDPNYLLVIRECFKDKILRTNIDATNLGNVARFFNHSCSPTMCVRLVRVETMIPRIAFFAAIDISPGTELTFDYGIKYGLSKQECKCGAKECCGYLPRFDDILESKPYLDIEGKRRKVL